MNTSVLKKIWRPFLAILLFIGLWEVATRLFSIEEWLLPAPSDIVMEARSVIPTFLPHLQSTVTLSVSGFLIGTTVGLGVATILHLMPRVRETFFPFIIISQNMPIIVLAPLLVIWFGFNALPKLIIITLACFFPIAVSALGGFTQTNRELVHHSVDFFRIKNRRNIQRHGSCRIRMARCTKRNWGIYDTCRFFVSNITRICSHYRCNDHQLSLLWTDSIIGEVFHSLAAEGGKQLDVGITSCE